MMSATLSNVDVTVIPSEKQGVRSWYRGCLIGFGGQEKGAEPKRWPLQPRPRLS